MKSILIIPTNPLLCLLFVYLILSDFLSRYTFSWTQLHLSLAEFKPSFIMQKKKKSCLSFTVLLLSYKVKRNDCCMTTS